jgi:hypothetical protein
MRPRPRRRPEEVREPRLELLSSAAMIKDPALLAKRQNSWASMLVLQLTITSDTGMAFSLGHHFPHRAAEAAHNLPLLIACGVLNEVPLDLRNQNEFYTGKDKRETLGVLMGYSRSALSWLNYRRIEQIKNARDDLAHHGVMLSHDYSWAAVDDVWCQLVAWGIVSP